MLGNHSFPVSGIVNFTGGGAAVLSGLPLVAALFALLTTACMAPLQRSRKPLRLQSKRRMLLCWAAVALAFTVLVIIVTLSTLDSMCWDAAALFRESGNGGATFGSLLMVMLLSTLVASTCAVGCCSCDCVLGPRDGSGTAAAAPAPAAATAAAAAQAPLNKSSGSSGSIASDSFATLVAHRRLASGMCVLLTVVYIFTAVIVVMIAPCVAVSGFTGTVAVGDATVSIDYCSHDLDAGSCPDRHVIVIGAGFAGAATARDLTLRGARVTLLEARNRLGGRTFTNADGYEVGAQWIHTPGCNPLRILADCYDLAEGAAFSDGEDLDVEPADADTDVCADYVADAVCLGFESSKIGAQEAFELATEDADLDDVTYTACESLAWGEYALSSGPWRESSAMLANGGHTMPPNWRPFSLHDNEDVTVEQGYSELHRRTWRRCCTCQHLCCG